MNKENHIEKVLWSIAFPGFCQILNGKFLKGIVFISLEILINVKSGLNVAIILSFNGNTEMAVKQTNYQWLMFYPCIYIFAIWDAYRDSIRYRVPYAFLPFVFSAYVGTIGVIYSPVFKIRNVLFGPIWLPIACLFLGALIGKYIRYLVITYTCKDR